MADRWQCRRLSYSPTVLASSNCLLSVCTVGCLHRLISTLLVRVLYLYRTPALNWPLARAAYLRHKYCRAAASQASGQWGGVGVRQYDCCRLDLKPHILEDYETHACCDKRAFRCESLESSCHMYSLSVRRLCTAHHVRQAEGTLDNDRVAFGRLQTRCGVQAVQLRLTGDLAMRCDKTEILFQALDATLLWLLSSASVVSHQPPVISHQPICHLPSAIIHQPSTISHPRRSVF